MILGLGVWEDATYKLQNGLILAGAVLSGAVVYMAVCRLSGVSVLTELREMRQKKRG